MRKTFASRAMAGLLLILGSSCSLVFDLSPDQCGLNADCAKLGNGLVCQEGLCICNSSECEGLMTSGGTSNGGSGGKGGSGGSTGGTAAVSGASGEVGTGGTSGSSGRGGSSAQGGAT